MAATFAIGEAKAVADAAWEVASASAIFASSPLERRFRDIRTLTQQVQGRKSHLQEVGAYLLGLEPTPGIRLTASRCPVRPGPRREQVLALGSSLAEGKTTCSVASSSAPRWRRGLPLASALADPLPVGAAAKVGLAPEGLQRLTDTLKSEVDKGRMPGAVVAIARKGQLAYFEAIGTVDPTSKAPMPRDAIFSIASMTKPMVSVAIMMLHDEGKLFLSDPIGKYLPKLANMQLGVIKTDASGKTIVETVPAARQPTIQDLLRHTANFLYGARGGGRAQDVAGLVVQLRRHIHGTGLIEALPRRRSPISRARSGTTAWRSTSRV